MDPQGSQAQHFVESTTTAEGGGERRGRGCLWTLCVGSVGASAVTLCGHRSPGEDIPSRSVSIPWDVSQGLLLSTLGSLLFILTIPLFLSYLSSLFWLPFSYVMEPIFSLQTTSMPLAFPLSCFQPT